MGSFSPYSISSWLNSTFPSLRKTQIINLGLAIFGMTTQQSANMSQIVRAWNQTTSHRHRWKRLQRFFSNHLIKPEILMQSWVRWCLKMFTSPDQPVKIAIDWSTLKQGHQMCMLALVCNGRGVPLMWQIVPTWQDIKDSQNRIEQRLLAKLINQIRSSVPEHQIILIGDRGFGYVDLIQFLLKKEVSFVLRVKADVIITTQDSQEIKLRNLHSALSADKVQWFPQITYRKHHPVSGINLAATVAEGSDDPWLLVTSLDSAEQTITSYQSRFQIEEWFKDLKHMIKIADLRTKNIKRIRRIVFTACIADGLLMMIGKHSNLDNEWKDRLIRGRDRSASLVWFAIRIIQHRLAPARFWGKVWREAKVVP